MKKLYSIAFLLTLLISGCNQEEAVNNQSQFSDSKKFTASFEQNESRTYIEEGNLLRWTVEDQISLFEGNTLNQQYQFTGKTGDNSGFFNKVNNTFGTGNDLDCHYAIYPYASDITITESGVITATLPAEQTYAENSFGLGDNTMVAVTQNVDDTFLKFKNVGGYLKLQLYGDDVTVKTITLLGNANEKIAGTANITATYGGEPTISMAEDAIETITLDCGEGVKIGTTAETATAFWLVVPPTTFESGFTIKIIDINGNIFTKATSNKIIIERNVIQPMNAIEIEFIPDSQIWYTSTTNKVISIQNESVTYESNEMVDGKGIITFSDNITTIPANLFYDNEELSSITIPSKVTNIGYNAFYSCGALSSVNIPNNEITIEYNAFTFCKSLKSFDFSKVTSVGGSAFAETGLTTVTLVNNANYGSSVFNSCLDLSTVTIEDGVQSISPQLFQSCTKITQITIPSSVTSIYFWAFKDCPIEHIYIEATTPPAIYDGGNLPEGFNADMPTGGAFTVQSTCTLHVPKNCAEQYRTAYGWKDFSTIVEIE